MESSKDVFYKGFKLRQLTGELVTCRRNQSIIIAVIAVLAASVASAQKWVEIGGSKDEKLFLDSSSLRGMCPLAV